MTNFIVPDPQPSYLHNNPLNVVIGCYRAFDMTLPKLYLANVQQLDSQEILEKFTALLPVSGSTKYQVGEMHKVFSKHFPPLALEPKNPLPLES